MSAYSKVPIIRTGTYASLAVHTITLVGNSNDPPRKYCILGSHKRLIDQSRLVKTGRKWSKLVETG